MVSVPVHFVEVQLVSTREVVVVVTTCRFELPLVVTADTVVEMVMMGVVVTLQLGFPLLVQDVALEVFGLVGTFV